MNENQTVNKQNEHTLNLDEIVSTQPELGPSVPDGGFGWIVFIATLFFQALVPCLLVNLGIFLAFAKLENDTAKDKNVLLWSENILYVPLFYCISKILFDSFSRSLVANTTSPRLIAVVGTCLTCAGLLFMWMGMTTNKHYWLFAFAGLFSGLGSTLILIQCDTLLTQYFRLKLPILNQISQTVAILGFIVAPIILGHHILNTSLTYVLLWYQAIILQGLIASIFFKRPRYLKTRPGKPYQFISPNPDDEEDILSKNSRELQIKRSTTTISKIPIQEPEAGSSTTTTETLVNVHTDHVGEPQNSSKTWDRFDEDDVKYAKVNNWETFDEDETVQKQNWEHFEDDAQSSTRIVNDLSLAEETNTQMNRPSSLFADFPVNNNNSYAYDDEIAVDGTTTNVFAPNNPANGVFRKHLEVLKELTFYKTLLMMIANTFSSFVFFALYPSYLYIQLNSVNIRHMSELIGTLSVLNLVFLCVAFCLKLDKKKPILYCIFYWTGSIGYFMIADFSSESLLLIGGAHVIVSIGALEFTSKPLFKIPAKGGTSSENLLLSIFSGSSLLLFLCLDVTFKTCFRMVAIIQFFTGTLWLVNYAYKRKRLT